MASLAVQARARISDAIADARDQDHSWDDIATCMGVSPSAARHRFAAYARTRPERPLED